ncbi:MAG: hypothetical protein SNF33_08180 [Candidatus Algichlamydia australiensis]|nr:hypothetical protein [Chlamydiales bacterium]
MNQVTMASNLVFGASIVSQNSTNSLISKIPYNYHATIGLGALCTVLNINKFAWSAAKNNLLRSCDEYFEVRKNGRTEKTYFCSAMIALAATASIIALTAFSLVKLPTPHPKLSHKLCSLTWKFTLYQGVLNVFTSANIVFSSLSFIINPEFSTPTSVLINAFALHHMRSWKALEASIFVPVQYGDFAKGFTHQYTFQVFGDSPENYHSISSDFQKLSVTKIVDDFCKKILSFDDYPWEIENNWSGLKAGELTGLALPKENLPIKLLPFFSNLSMYLETIHGPVICLK